MLKIFKKILQQNDPGGKVAQPAEDELQRATCMLLLETAQADGTIHPEEERQIHTVIKKRFSLSENEAVALIERAREDQAENIDLYPVTSQINRHWPAAEKCRLLENIWEIVYADGILDQHEDYLMHKLGTMLHLSHRQLIDAKLRAKKATS